MDFLDLVENRYSVRSYRKDPVEQTALDTILKAAQLAPTAANRQAFRIVVIHTEGHEGLLENIYHRPFFTQAPIVLGIFAKTADAWVRSDGVNYALADAAIVMDHMVLAATSLGLGTCWVANFDPQAARREIGIGPAYEPVAFTPLGYSAVLPIDKKRKTLEALVTYLP